MEFKWNPAIFKVLGVHFSTNTEIVPSINYEGKQLEIQKLLNAWSKRYLTPLGKIAVIKSLVVSKITYVTMNIPDPREGFIQELKKKRNCLIFVLIFFIIVIIIILFIYLFGGGGGRERSNKTKDVLSSF